MRGENRKQNTQPWIEARLSFSGMLATVCWKYGGKHSISIAECDLCHFSRPTLDSIMLSAVHITLLPAIEARSYVLCLVKLGMTTTLTRQHWLIVHPSLSCQLVTYLDPDDKGFITKEYLQNLSIDQLKDVLLFIDPNDVSNTDELEYSHIEALDIE